MVVADQHDSTKSENYTNVLEKSTLRPDVEPFVPKAQNGTPCYMVGNGGGFSLDAPEFVPNVYGNSSDMYTWVSNQFIVAPSTNHPRFSIPRFRDKFMRQHRSRGNRNYNNNNGRNHYENEQQQNQYHQPQHRTFNKIEQRHHHNNKSNNNNNASCHTSNPPPQPLHKPIKIETKQEQKSKGEPKHEELVPTVVLPEIDESVMSYRMALVGSSAEPDQPKPLPQPVEKEMPRAKTEQCKQERSDRRNDKFIPAGPKEEEKTGYAGKPQYGNRSGGRPKPTKGSGIQLNIFSLVQDKKVKKKKMTRTNGQVNNVCNNGNNKVANPLDSSAPGLRRGKEREEGKPKKLSKMKKIIVKEKTEISENGESLKISVPGYCSQLVTSELNKSLSDFLSQLREYNDKAYRTGSANKRRYCCGLREARKYLKLNRVKCIIIPPNIDKIVSKGGLYDCVHDIINLSSQQNIPIFYGLNKTRISKLLARPKSTITSAVSVFNYDGVEILWTDVLHHAAIARERYQQVNFNDALKEEYDEEGLEEGDGSSDEGEEFEDDNNEDEAELINESADIDNDSVSSSFVDSGIENNEISSLSLENGHTSGEG